MMQDMRRNLSRRFHFARLEEEPSLIKDVKIETLRPKDLNTLDDLINRRP